MESCQVAAVFSSNMVLQREKKIRVFGEGRDGESVCVSLSLGSTELAWEVSEISKGRWLVELPPQKACNGATLTVRCGAFEKVMTNVAIGEVWLCGGQSNMEMELQNIQDGRKFLREDREPNVRFYYTQKKGYRNEDFYETERQMCWKEFSEQDAACWSGVGYLFGRELAAKLGVTVGLIGCNWGGTSASTWTSRESLLADREVSVYWTDYEQGNVGKTLAEQIAEYEAYEKNHAEWTKKQEACYREDPQMDWGTLQEKIGPCQWPGPMNARNPFRPAGLYECMLLRIAPYTLRGVLFYQGESDDHRPKLYYSLFTRLIAQWRKDFREQTLPFLFVQLPMHRYAADPDYKHWCLIREAQMDCFATVKGTGIAVAIDCGEFNEIHPKDKRPVAHRLYLQALQQVYGLADEAEAMGPMYRDYIVRGREIELCFDYAENGFKVRGEEPCGFEIAGADKRFVPAKARIAGERIYVSSTAVEQPRYARYLWTNYGEVNLYGANGLPAAPFRTSREDETQAVEVKTEIQQVMEVGGNHASQA